MTLLEAITSEVEVCFFFCFRKVVIVVGRGSSHYDMERCGCGGVSGCVQRSNKHLIQSTQTPELCVAALIGASINLL